MNDRIIAAVNYGELTGTLNPAQHGSNTAPILSSRALLNLDQELKDLHFHGTRTHDWALWNHGQRVIDTHFVFPLENADPKNPDFYYFDASDEVIRLAHSIDNQVFYRLGTSIEHSGEKHFNINVPKDFHHYAEILAGIIRHYTAGWANGFHYPMEYWEIWNEPDGVTNMWNGTREEFIEFFTVVLKRLKEEFPNLKIGGPALTWLNQDYFTELLNACKKAGVEPDFISWHSYTSNPAQLIAQPAAARKFLDELGFHKVETCINEWHYLLSWEGIQSSASSELYKRAVCGPTGLNGIDSAAFNLAVLSGWQSTPLDSAFYYGAGVDGNWGFRDVYRSFNKSFYSMKMFGQILSNCTDQVASHSFSSSIFTLGAWNQDKTKAMLLIVDYRGSSPVLDVQIDGLEHVSYLSARTLDNSHNNFSVPVEMHRSVLSLTKQDAGSAAFLVEFEL